MIRPLLAADIPGLAASLAAMQPWSRLGYSAEGLGAYLGRSDPSLKRCVDLDPGGRPVAVLCLRSPWLRGPAIELLAVLPQAQGQGRGRDLIAWAVSQGGGANLWTCVSAFNHAARAFYARHGFIETGRFPDLIQDGEEEILLRRHPAPSR